MNTTHPLFIRTSNILNSPSSNKGTFQPCFTVLTGRLGKAQKNLPEYLIRDMTPAFDPTILTLIRRRRSLSCLSVRAVECCSPRVQAVRKVAAQGESEVRLHDQDYRLSQKDIHQLMY